MDIFDFRERGKSGVDEETERFATAVIGAAIEVHRELGPGLPEGSYHQALSHELDLRGIPHQNEAPVPIVYKGKTIDQGWNDILVSGRLIVELKSVETLLPVHRAQVVTYVKVTKLQLGLLINFNVIMLRRGIVRVINTQ